MSTEVSSLTIPLLWIVFTAAALISAAVGIIIAYHWTRFSASPTIGFFTVVAYAGGCVVLLGVMMASILAIS